jgi:hypothetical protein
MDNDSLALGMEIRDRVSNFVAEKIKTLRINSGNKKVKKKFYF